MTGLVKMEDKRGFRRYSANYACEIRMGRDVYKGVIVDYSDGLGVITEQAPPLEKGSTADIRIIDSNEKIRVAVAWVRQVNGTVKIGFSRVGNLKGTLRDFRLPDLLIGIQRGTKTGILEIASGSVIKQVFIKNGDMIYAESSVTEDRLGEMLVREGKITLDQFNEASKRLIATGEKLGKILVEMSCLTPKELYHAVQRQIKGIILSLFPLEEGVFEFREHALPLEGLITLRISAADIICRGIRRMTSIVHVKQMCPHLDTVLDVSQNPLNIYQSLSLSEVDKKILSCINGEHSIKKILALSPADNFATLKAIAAFINIGLVSSRTDGDAPAVVSATEILEGHGNSNAAEFMAKVKELRGLCDVAGYYDFLGVQRDASKEEIDRAYHRISREFHPDRHFSFPGYNIKGKLIKIFSYATEAYNILSDAERRKGYDETLKSDHEHEQEAEISDRIQEKAQQSVHDAPCAPEAGNTIISDAQEDEGGIKSNSAAHYELGVAYKEMELMDEAINEFQIAAHDPDWRVTCGKIIAACRREMGDYARGIEEIKQILASLTSDHEDYLDVVYELALMHEQNTEMEEAFRLYSEIQSRNAGYRDVAERVLRVNGLRSGVRR